MTSRITELATLVSANTAKVEDYLRSNNLPFPSFDVDGPVDLKLSPEIDSARVAAIEASIELQELLQGPVEALKPMV